jgi:DEAD/DEAH box helicase domain-containing protein
MLPLHQSYEIKESIREYLKATFTFQQPEINQAFDSFISNERNGIFKGPYVSIKLPFVKASATDSIPLEIVPSFLPYKHQLVAFERLSAQNGHIPQPTLLTTGTGSGKTESFLFPLLDYCYANRNKKGIKAIILYPMNALATDQAKRMAKTIYADPRTKGKITAGLFIGEGTNNKNAKNQKKFPMEMGAENIIEHREAILESPPDILLTNFKMLDYALMRNKFHSLWSGNFKDKTILKFLILDELHTYDGAQGSDVANLIRRLKLKLDISENQLCPVGTSATIGSGSDAKKLLIDYASKLFEEDIFEDAVIEESRLSFNEFIGNEPPVDIFPTVDAIRNNALKPDDNAHSYIQNQLELWGINSKLQPSALGSLLLKINFFRQLIEVSSNGVKNLNELIAGLSMVNAQFEALARENEPLKLDVIKSIIALISHTKIREGKNEFPFLYVQSQLWIRGLLGVSRLVQNTPRFVWNNEKIEENTNALPSYFCRECGNSGWVGLKRENSDAFETDLKLIYDRFFSHNRNIYFVFPYSEDALAGDYKDAEIEDEYLNPSNLGLYSKQKEGYIRILRCRKLNNTKIDVVCPHCNTRNTIALIGTGVASMASVSSGQVLASSLDFATEQERKLLIFTNSVQDAAHQAGFIEARNFRFTFRTALQFIINNNEKPVKLTELYNQFVNYWSHHSDPTNELPIEAFLYKFFPTDYVGNLKIDAFKTGKESFRKGFVEEFNKRMFWEISSEFGYNATIGRTLEKTGVSTAYIELSRIKTVFGQMKFWLSDNGLNSITEDQFIKFATGFLYRLRTRGGIDHEFLKKFRTERTNYFLITRNTNPQHIFIKNFGKFTRLPKFVTDDTSQFAKIFDITNIRADVKNNWYHKYFRKCFFIPTGDLSTESLLINDFFQKFLEYLDSENILDKKIASGVKNYGLNPSEIVVTKNVAQLRCNKCGHIISHSKDSADEISQMPCVQYNCSGHYAYFINDAYNYYKTVYNRAHAIRIFSAEHTGLLERKTRERLENNFKKRPYFNSTNLLVATSTLEMGIDVGDLNATFNTAVPPLSANYLQRIGRAGRSSGNAVVLCFAGKENHDQYYYQEPKEMIDGIINTPGCFIEAKEILKRHFIAFCFDSWTTSDPINNAIPPIIRYLRIESIREDDPDFVLNKIISFIRVNEESLISKFRTKYIKFISSQDSINSLEIELKNGLLYDRLHKIFKNLAEEISLYNSKKKATKIRIDSLPKTDPEKLELEKDIRNINGAIKNFYSRNFIEYLTNIGVLPNYAFPETGVSLDVQIRERTGDEQGASFQTKSLELIRPAKSAIRELAPDNVFYSQGTKMNITGIRIINRNDEIVKYRFCSKCDNLMLDIKSKPEPCPKCGDNSWLSASNVHQFVKMTAMVSYNDSSQATINDSNEDREFKKYNISKHFSIDYSSSQGAHVLKQIPFGIEYLRYVSVLEVNTGIIDGFFDRSRVVSINGNEHSDYGFIVCKTCGKISVRPQINHAEPENYHFGYCKNKTVEYSGSNDENFDELYLYRELVSEAIKILLPIQEIDSETNIKLFKAGLFLGLKKYYKGNPQHLEIFEYSEQNKATGKTDQYLMLIESIPGGTGYLSKLFDEAEFSDLLKLAYESIRDCNCQRLGKDGCYHCIYTYSNQYDRAILSRSSAERLFEKIYSKTNEWLYLEEGLNSVTNSGNIEESELEERFIKLLKNYAKNSINSDLGYEFESKQIDGITNYQLKIVNGNQDIYYQIAPQFRINQSSGVSYPTVADFLIRCIDYKVNGVSDITKIECIKPLTIYLDGYAFHAVKPNNRFISDIQKRKAILQSNNFYTYNLTWDDLSRYETKETDRIIELSNTKIITDLAVRIKHPKYPKNFTDYLKARNSFERLVSYLENPLNDELVNNFKTLLFSLQTSLLGKVLSKENALDFINEPLKFDSSTRFEEKDPKKLAFLDSITSTKEIHYRIFQNPETLSVHGKVFVLEDRNIEIDKTTWELFWNIFNTIQFFNEIEVVFYSEQINETPLESNDLILKNFPEKYHALVNELISRNIDFNETETFVLVDKGQIIAEADLGIESKKMVIGVFDGYQDIFIKNGYQVFEIESFNIEIL